ncbi:MAG TPA: hypothetical protein VM095_05415 [Pyrinomonadaceae bacterium]|nr:hypothetical protein [Pyrinomonadaceae bacterium]
MKSESDNDELVQRFLLGSLSESERAQVEDRFFANDNFFQELLTGEDDLIDAYVRGELPAAERALFEQSYLSTQTGRERVEFAQALFKSVSVDESAAIGAMTREAERKVSPSRPRSLFDAFAIRRPALSFTLAAALLVIVLGGLWLLINRGQTRTAQEEARTRQAAPVTPRDSSPSVETAQQQQPASGDENSNPTPPRETPKKPVPISPVIATFTLMPGTVRDEGGAATLVLSGRATEVRLQLILEGERYRQYRAALSTADGRKLWGRVVAKRTSGKSGNLPLSLPAELLKNGDYVLDLSGAKSDGEWESVADYSFRVVKK